MAVDVVATMDASAAASAVKIARRLRGIARGPLKRVRCPAEIDPHKARGVDK
jgi:hypothetical protein